MSMDTEQFLVLDTETTGVDPTKDAVCEIAYEVTTIEKTIASGSSLVNPGRPIPPEASAIHHLVDKDVISAPTIQKVLESWTMGLLRHGPFTAYVAHNAPFDAGFLPMLSRAPWLDTLRLAKRLRPTYQFHGNEYLRYKEGLTGPGIDDSIPHRAAHDVAVTAALLRKLLGEINGSTLWPQTVDGIIRDLAAPMILYKAEFGKHKDTLWSEVPKDYLSWIVKQAEMDPDVRFTAQHYLRTR
jgi:exodeoxyribonuclease X